MADKDLDNKKPGGNTMLIVGLCGGGLMLLTCCCGTGVGGFFLWPKGPAAGIGGLGKTDVVGRWENNEISRLILDLQADGAGAIEIPEAKVRIRITHQIQGNELRIAPAPGEAAGFGERDAVERFQHLRITRMGNTLRIEALAGPGQGQVSSLKKIG
jgi:hypothetical protein